MVSLSALDDWCEAVIRNGGAVGSSMNRLRRRVRKLDTKQVTQVKPDGWDRCQHGVSKSWAPCTKCNASAARRKNGWTMGDSKPRDAAIRELHTRRHDLLDALDRVEKQVDELELAEADQQKWSSPNG